LNHSENSNPDTRPARFLKPGRSSLKSRRGVANLLGLD